MHLPPNFLKGVFIVISKCVMKTHEFDDSIIYKVECSCGSDEHNVTIEFELQSEIPGMIFLNFYKKIAWCCHWGKTTWCEKLWKRISCSVKMLFTGYVELTESFILEDESNIDGFIEALQEGKNYIKKKKEEQNNDKH
jgi:hypothetical protein